MLRARLTHRTDEVILVQASLVAEFARQVIFPITFLPPEPEKPADTSNAEAMATYLQQQTAYEIVVDQIQADFRARRQALQNADTSFERGFVAMVALSQSGRKTVCKFDNAWLWLIE